MKQKRIDAHKAKMDANAGIESAKLELLDAKMELRFQISGMVNRGLNATNDRGRDAELYMQLIDYYARVTDAEADLITATRHLEDAKDTETFCADMILLMDEK